MSAMSDQVAALVRENTRLRSRLQSVEDNAAADRLRLIALEQFAMSLGDWAMTHPEVRDRVEVLVRSAKLISPDVARKIFDLARGHHLMAAE